MADPNIKKEITNFERLNLLCSKFAARKKLLENPNMKNLIDHLKLKGFNFDFFWNCPAFELKDSLIDVEHTVVPLRYQEKITKEDQYEDLKILSEDLHQNNVNTIVFAGCTDFTKARFVAFALLLLNLFKEGIPDRYKWIGVRGGFDSQETPSENYLIVDNIASNSSKPKLEKVSDLLFSNRTTTIIIAAGINPLKLMAEDLNYSFNHIFYFDEGLHLQY